MGKQVIKTFYWRCDNCGAHFGPVQDYPDQSDVIPVGWRYITFYDCGMTGYTMTQLCCPACATGHVELDASGSRRAGGGADDAAGEARGTKKGGAR